MAPSLFEPERGQTLHIVCLIQYQTPKAYLRMDAAEGGDVTAVAELRDDLVRLKIPTIKAENIHRNCIYANTLELWWWNQKGRGPLHNTLEKVLCQNMRPSDIEDEEMCVQSCSKLSLRYMFTYAMTRSLSIRLYAYSITVVRS